jgi:hypothetical protein
MRILGSKRGNNVDIHLPGRSSIAGAWPESFIRVDPCSSVAQLRSPHVDIRVHLWLIPLGLTPTNACPGERWAAAQVSVRHRRLDTPSTTTRLNLFRLNPCRVRKRSFKGICSW